MKITAVNNSRVTACKILFHILCQLRAALRGPWVRRLAAHFCFDPDTLFYRGQFLVFILFYSITKQGDENINLWGTSVRPSLNQSPQKFDPGRKMKQTNERILSA